ncbi:hypothetical protein BDW66DRAFT_133627 [Aspergillus desertorum]
MKTHSTAYTFALYLLFCHTPFCCSQAYVPGSLALAPLRQTGLAFVLKRVVSFGPVFRCFVYGRKSRTYTDVAVLIPPCFYVMNGLFPVTRCTPNAHVYCTLINSSIIRWKNSSLCHMLPHLLISILPLFYQSA